MNVVSDQTNTALTIRCLQKIFMVCIMPVTGSPKPRNIECFSCFATTSFFAINQAEKHCVSITLSGKSTLMVD